MVCRNLNLNFNFFCVTDDPTGIDKNIQCLPPFSKNPQIHGWFHKLSLTKCSRFGITGKILYMDLDVVITDNIDELLTHTNKFCIIEDWLYTKMGQKKFNSSVMSWISGQYYDLEEQYLQKKKQYKTWTGDQDFITDSIPEAKLWPIPWCVSYKWHKCWQGIPNGAKIVVFHGKPNPEEALDSSSTFGRGIRGADWVRQYWW